MLKQLEKPRFPFLTRLVRVKRRQGGITAGASPASDCTSLLSVKGGLLCQLPLIKNGSGGNRRKLRIVLLVLQKAHLQEKKRSLSSKTKLLHSLLMAETPSFSEHPAQTGPNQRLCRQLIVSMLWSPAWNRPELNHTLTLDEPDLQSD